MQSSVDKTRSYLRKALDKELALYERYVLNPEVLATYLELTKEALLAVVADVFDHKISEVAAGSRSRGDKLNTISALGTMKVVSYVERDGRPLEAASKLKSEEAVRRTDNGAMRTSSQTACSIHITG